MKRPSIAEIIAAVFILFFVHSAVSNLIQLQSLKNLLGFYTFNTSAVAWSIVIVETAIASLLLIPRTRRFGFLTVQLFALYAGYTVLRRPHFPHDFGGLLNHVTFKQQLLFYSLLALLAIAGIYL